MQVPAGEIALEVLLDQDQSQALDYHRVPVGAAQAAVPAGLAGRATISVSRARGVGSPVRVTVRVPHRLFRLVGGIPVQVGWTVTMRSEG